MKHSALFILLSALFAHSSVMATETNIAPQSMGTQTMANKAQDIHEIYLAGGCFWGIEA